MADVNIIHTDDIPVMTHKKLMKLKEMEKIFANYNSKDCVGFVISFIYRKKHHDHFDNEFTTQVQGDHIQTDEVLDAYHALTEYIDSELIRMKLPPLLTRRSPGYVQ